MGAGRPQRARMLWRSPPGVGLGFGVGLCGARCANGRVRRRGRPRGSGAHGAPERTLPAPGRHTAPVLCGAGAAEGQRGSVCVTEGRAGQTAALRRCRIGLRRVGMPILPRWLRGAAGAGEVSEDQG